MSIPKEGGGGAAFVPEVIQTEVSLASSSNVYLQTIENSIGAYAGNSLFSFSDVASGDAESGSEYFLRGFTFFTLLLVISIFCFVSAFYILNEAILAMRSRNALTDHGKPFTS